MKAGKLPFVRYGRALGAQHATERWDNLILGNGVASDPEQRQRYREAAAKREHRHRLHAARAEYMRSIRAGIDRATAAERLTRKLAALGVTHG